MLTDSGIQALLSRFTISFHLSFRQNFKRRRNLGLCILASRLVLQEEDTTFCFHISRQYERWSPQIFSQTAREVSHYTEVRRPQRFSLPTLRFHLQALASWGLGGFFDFVTELYSHNISLPSVKASQSQTIKWIHSYRAHDFPSSFSMLSIFTVDARN